MSYYSHENIAHNIGRLLKERGEKQKEFASAIGINPNDVSAKLSGKAYGEQKPKYFTMQQIFDAAEHFNVSLDELCGSAENNRIQRVESVSDVLSILFCSEDVIDIQVHESVIQSNNGESVYKMNEASVYFKNIFLNDVLVEWNELSQALREGELKDRILRDWKSAKLQQYKNNRL